ncbi:MAG: hypothetical protein K1X56_07205 [Flavobacteriales bacterium]|nr:hypothetical protein [Flavobacteriales bacterium]
MTIDDYWPELNKKTEVFTAAHLNTEKPAANIAKKVKAHLVHSLSVFPSSNAAQKIFNHRNLLKIFLRSLAG